VAAFLSRRIQEMDYRRKYLEIKLIGKKEKV